MIDFVGLSGAIIPKGFLLIDENGNQWKTSNQYVIGLDGRITGFVESVVLGNISASPNTINKFIVALSGLDRVNNPAAAIVGSEEENARDFETRRADSVAANASLVDNAVRGTIAGLTDVVDVWVHSNNSSLPTTFGKTDYPVERNSILVSVVGGDDYDIAWNILVKAGTGCGFVGNTTVEVKETESIQVSPPKYTVKFLRPNPEDVHFKLTIDNRASLSLQDETAIKNAIVDSFKSGSTKARIAQVLRAVQYISPILNAVSLNVISLQVSLNGTTWVDFLEFGVDQFPVTDPSLITVVGL